MRKTILSLTLASLALAAANGNALAWGSYGGGYGSQSYETSGYGYASSCHYEHKRVRVWDAYQYHWVYEYQDVKVCD